MSLVWKYPSDPPPSAKALARSLDIHPIIARLLVQRGFTQPEQADLFLRADLNQLTDPSLLPGMDTAVRRIRQAVAGREPIGIWGDYDIDGLSGCAILYQALKRLKADVHVHLPHRDDGYGLSKPGLERLSQAGVRLLITVDCGVSAHSWIEWLRERRIDVIVTDHHRVPSEGVPDCLAVVHPQAPGSRYPGPNLAGAGVAFKLAEALIGRQTALVYLDLAALGTIGDVVPLYGENRIIVRHGLKRISDRTHPGLVALLDVAGIRKSQISATQIAFGVIPRLNARGRLGDPRAAFDLLAGVSSQPVGVQADLLDADNRQRQDLERRVVQDAIGMVESQVQFARDRAIVVWKAGWHAGVIGIVAARLVERYYRPSFVISVDAAGTAKGSVRSIPGFDVVEALSACQSVLTGFGGHAQAAGFSLPGEQLEAFRQALLEVAGRLLTPEALEPRLPIDLALSLSEVDLNLAQSMSDLAPFGAGNPTPVFVSEPVTARINHSRSKGPYRAWVEQDGRTLPVISFKPHWIFEPKAQSQPLSVVYQLGVNQWEGESTVELRLKDARPLCEPCRPSDTARILESPAPRH